MDFHNTVHRFCLHKTEIKNIPIKENVIFVIRRISRIVLMVKFWLASVRERSIGVFSVELIGLVSRMKGIQNINKTICSIPRFKGNCSHSGMHHDVSYFLNEVATYKKIVLFAYCFWRNCRWWTS